MHLPKGTIVEVKESGVSPSKLILDMSFMGREGVNDKNGMFQPKDWVSYSEVCNIESNSDHVKTYDENMNQMFIKYIDQMGEIRYVQTENTRTIANKTRFAMRNDFGGVSAVLIDMDDSIEKCSFEADTFDDFKPVDGVYLNIPSRYYRNSPLIRTINDAIHVSLDEIQQEKQLKDPNRNPVQSTNILNSIANLFLNLIREFYKRIIFRYFFIFRD